MSAYICNPEHFGLLAAYYATKENKGSEFAERAAHILALENIRSVATRYPDDKDGQRPGPCMYDDEICLAARVWAKCYFNRLPAFTSPVAILGMCSCLDYQSCETEDWRSTKAFGLLCQIESCATRQLPGYDDAPWNWSDEKQPDMVKMLYNDLGYNVEV